MVVASFEDFTKFFFVRECLEILTLYFHRLMLTFWRNVFSEDIYLFWCNWVSTQWKQSVSQNPRNVGTLLPDYMVSHPGR